MDETEKANNPPRTELLAPAGDWDGLRAAVANGADAVYFGLPRHNARQRASNFTLDELDRVIDHLHGRNVRGYVAMNTLLFTEELGEAADYVARIAAAGADAVIVQDLGLAALIARMAPSLPIHASTQMTLTDGRGIEAAREMGLPLARVILARELSLDHIAAIRRETDVELEVFVHGAMCISVSGQCQASQTLFGRSGNRGQCAQVCRLPYDVLVSGEPIYKGDDPQRRRFPLSPRDLAAYDRVARLVELGVAGLKIEGRLKDPTYVAATTAAYRAALDAALAAGPTSKPFQLAPDLRAALGQTFSRGWTAGFLDGADPRKLVDGRFVGRRGQFVGTVERVSARGVVVRLAKSSGLENVTLHPGDGVVFEDEDPSQREIGGRIYSVTPVPDIQGPRISPRRSQSAQKNEKERQSPRNAFRGLDLVELTFGRDQWKPAAVRIGAAVFKTDDPQLRKRLEATFARDEMVRREPIFVRVEVAVGRAVRVQVRDRAGHVAEVVSADPAQRAIKHPLTVEQLGEPFARLGNTPFAVAGIEIGPPGDDPAADLAVMVPKSVLNDLRRRAVEQLIEQRRASARHVVRGLGIGGMGIGDWALGIGERIKPVDRAEADSQCPMPKNQSPFPLSPGLCVLVRSKAQLETVLAWRERNGDCAVATIYLDLIEPGDLSDSAAACRSAGVAVGWTTNRICLPGEEEFLEEVIRASKANCEEASGLPRDVVLVDNLSAAQFFREHLPSAPLIASQWLNVANDLSARWLLATGVSGFTPANELSASQVAAMGQGVGGKNVEPVVFGHPAMFHTRHCLFAGNAGQQDPTQKPPREAGCNRPCRSIPPGEFRLRDRIGAELIVLCDRGCRNTIFAARPINALRHVAAWRAAGIGRFRVELLLESPEETAALLDDCRNALTEGKP